MGNRYSIEKAKTSDDIIVALEKISPKVPRMYISQRGHKGIQKGIYVINTRKRMNEDIDVNAIRQHKFVFVSKCGMYVFEYDIRTNDKELIDLSIRYHLKNYN